MMSNRRAADSQSRIKLSRLAIRTIVPTQLNKNSCEPEYTYATRKRYRRRRSGAYTVEIASGGAAAEDLLRARKGSEAGREARIPPGLREDAGEVDAA